MALFTATCADNRGYVTGSVPMSLGDARAFLLRELELINLGPDQSGEFERERISAREVVKVAQCPVTLRVGFWTVTLEAAEGKV